MVIYEVNYPRPKHVGFPAQNDKPAQYPSVVIAVPDVKQYMKMLEEVGGKILGEPWEQSSDYFHSTQVHAWNFVR